MAENIYLHNMNIGCINLSHNFQSHWATDMTTTRPRNHVIARFLLFQLECTALGMMAVTRYLSRPLDTVYVCTWSSPYGLALLGGVW